MLLSGLLVSRKDMIKKRGVDDKSVMKNRDDSAKEDRR